MNEKNKLLDLLKNETNVTYTENLAKTNITTKSSLLDFFSMGGAIRGRSDNDIISLFSKAFSEDQLLTLKMLFYFRDIRGGQGERKVFRTILHYLGQTQPTIVLKNLDNIPFYGRWDDLYSLVNTRIQKDVFEMMYNKLSLDLELINKEKGNPSLLAKWLKSENTSSKESRELAQITRKAFGLRHKEYRSILSKLRKKIRIVESKMCMNDWTSINYEHVPSRASMIYRKAFKKHDPSGYELYLNSVEKGEKTIKTKTLYPYDLIRNARDEYNKTIELQWKNLPDYTKGRNENSIVVCDVSGSMTGLGWGSSKRTVEPILVSISLSIYFAERSNGPYKDHFITFSHRPQLQEIKGSNLYEKYNNLINADWEMNTDIQAVFDLILRIAKENKLSQEEMIHKIYIISDMEFDQADPQNKHTNFQIIEQKYKEAGYERPSLIFWNVDARQNQSPVTIDDKGIFLVSGCSPSILENLMENKALNAYDLMLTVLNSERYNRIKI